MAIINTTEIVGYKIDEDVVCLECGQDLDRDEMKQDNIIVTHEIHDAESRGYEYYCDRCGSKINEV